MKRAKSTLPTTQSEDAHTSTGGWFLCLRVCVLMCLSGNMLSY